MVEALIVLCPLLHYIRELITEPLSTLRETRQILTEM